MGNCIKKYFSFKRQSRIVLIDHEKVKKYREKIKVKLKQYEHLSSIVKNRSLSNESSKKGVDLQNKLEKIGELYKEYMKTTDIKKIREQDLPKHKIWTIDLESGVLIQPKINSSNKKSAESKIIEIFLEHKIFKQRMQKESATRRDFDNYYTKLSALVFEQMLKSENTHPKKQGEFTSEYLSGSNGFVDTEITKYNKNIVKNPYIDKKIEKSEYDYNITSNNSQVNNLEIQKTSKISLEQNSGNSKIEESDDNICIKSQELLHFSEKFLTKRFNSDDKIENFKILNKILYFDSGNTINLSKEFKPKT